MKKNIKREFDLLYLSQNGDEDNDKAYHHILTYDPDSTHQKIASYLKPIFRSIEKFLPDGTLESFILEEETDEEIQEIRGLDESCHVSTALALLIHCYASMAEFYDIITHEQWTRQFCNKIDGRKEKHVVADSLVVFGEILGNGCVNEIDKSILERKAKAAIHRIEVKEICNVLGLNTQSRKYLVVAPKIKGETVVNPISQEVLKDPQTQTVEYFPVGSVDETFQRIFGKSFLALKSEIEKHLECLPFEIFINLLEERRIAQPMASLSFFEGFWYNQEIDAYFWGFMMEGCLLMPYFLGKKTAHYTKFELKNGIIYSQLKIFLGSAFEDNFRESGKSAYEIIQPQTQNSIIGYYIETDNFAWHKGDLEKSAFFNKWMHIPIKPPLGMHYFSWERRPDIVWDQSSKTIQGISDKRFEWFVKYREAVINGKIKF